MCDMDNNKSIFSVLIVTHTPEIDAEYLNERIFTSESGF